VAELRAFVRWRRLSFRAAQIAKSFCAKMNPFCAARRKGGESVVAWPVLGMIILFCKPGLAISLKTWLP
jgi:hypothetical protein